MVDKKYTDEEMASLSKAVMQYIDRWQLSNTEIIHVLGLDPKTRTRHLQHFRTGDKSLPQEKEVMQRIDHIVGIADALRTTFPFSEQMRLLWLRKPHRRFRKNTPLAVIMEKGVNGLMKVRIEVDCAYGWKISEELSRHQQENR
ncbi:MAG: DUF2384 domain-containing protein [Cocleimonas sp.]|nr:DUF2384 domain-containing protein [Cocleimonas sp.]